MSSLLNKAKISICQLAENLWLDYYTVIKFRSAIHHHKIIATACLTQNLTEEMKKTPEGRLTLCARRILSSINREWKKD